MSTTILTTKLNVPPPRADWISRPRLIDSLDQGLRTKLTLVSAPAGFGKSTLVTSWLHGLADRLPAPPRLAWLSLEEDDTAPLRFLAYLTAALKTLDGSVGHTALSLLEAPQPPHPNHVITLLINDLAELPATCVLVLDDFHVVSHPDIQGAVAYLLEHLPSQLHVIITTREEPSLPLARLRVQSQVTEIRLEHLRFTRDEATAFLGQTMGLTLDADLVEALESRTEGWVAGLQMAALSLRGRDHASGIESLPFTLDDFGGHSYIIDYLGAEVLRQQSAEARAFLRQTSILDRLNAPLCDAVTGHPGSREFLCQLAQANLFLIPLDDQRRWYRYHSLFADFLRTELDERERRSLHRRACAWYEAHGFTPEAIKHALAAHDLAAAERLIRGSVEDTLNAGGFTTLLTWINALPDHRVRTSSDLSAYKAWILYLRGEIAEAEEYAATAAEGQRPDDPPAQRGIFLGFRAYLELNRGDPARAAELGREALALLGNTKSFFRTTALSHLGQAQRLTGDRQAAIQTLRQAVTLGQQLRNPMIALDALGYLTLLLFQQGQLREAILLCQQALAPYADQKHTPPVAGLAFIPLGTLHLETNDLEQAERCLKTGIALCQQMGTVYYTLVGQRSLAKLQCARGAIEAAWETVAAARRLAIQSESPRRIRMVNALTAEIQLRQGQVTAAARTLADLHPSPQARSGYENLTFARLLLARDAARAAHALLQELQASAEQQGRLGTLITIHVLQALAEQALRHDTAALDRLEHAIALAAPEGCRRVFLDEGPALVPLLSDRRHVAPEFVDGLLSALPPAPPPLHDVSAPGAAADAANQALMEPLSETQLTILRLVSDGLSNQEIADTLRITVGTTKWHLNQIYGKLGVASRTQALAHARRIKLL
jgi:LuxR family maltose regulon positive regulatory protein